MNRKNLAKKVNYTYFIVFSLPGSFTCVHQHTIFVPSKIYTSLSCARQDDLLSQMNFVIVYLINSQTLKSNNFSVVFNRAAN